MYICREFIKVKLGTCWMDDADVDAVVLHHFPQLELSRAQPPVTLVSSIVRVLTWTLRPDDPILEVILSSSMRSRISAGLGRCDR